MTPKGSPAPFSRGYMGEGIQLAAISVNIPPDPPATATTDSAPPEVARLPHHNGTAHRNVALIIVGA